VRAAFLSATGGTAPATLGFNAVTPEWPSYGAADAAPAIPAPESTLGSHPCVALSSAQVHPEWTTLTSPCNTFPSNGDYPLNFVSHSRGSLQTPSSYTCPAPADTVVAESLSGAQ
jgi:hypothetical protein